MVWWVIIHWNNFMKKIYSNHLICYKKQIINPKWKISMKKLKNAALQENLIKKNCDYMITPVQYPNYHNILNMFSKSTQKNSINYLLNTLFFYKSHFLYCRSKIKRYCHQLGIRRTKSLWRTKKCIISI